MTIGRLVTSFVLGDFSKVFHHIISSALFVKRQVQWFFFPTHSKSHQRIDVAGHVMGALGVKGRHGRAAGKSGRSFGLMTTISAIPAIQSTSNWKVLVDIPGSCAVVGKETEASSMQPCTHAMGMHMLDIQEATTCYCISRVSFTDLHQNYYILPATWALWKPIMNVEAIYCSTSMLGSNCSNPRFLPVIWFSVVDTPVMD